jgi:glycosyltransferase involved in cell wall biosynthesis
LRRLRVALVANGPADDLHTSSGVAHGMLEALRGHRLVERVVVIDAGFRGFRKSAVAVRTFKLPEAGWRVKYSQGRVAVRVRSRLVRRQLRRFGCDVDVAVLVRGLYEPLDCPYALFIDSTTALTQAGWPPLALGPGSHAWSVRADSAQLHRAAHVFTASRHVAEHVVLDYGIPHDRVSTIGGGLNYALAEVPQHRPSSVPTVLFVGHDFRRKGGDVLVEAFRRVRAEIPTAQLQLVGRQTSRVEGGAGVVVLGEVDDRRRLSQLYSAASVFCLPARFEPYGLVLLEAMAHGVPCVGTRVGAIPEILADGNLGLLVDAEDPAGLADTLITLLRNRELRGTLSKRGRADVEATKTWDMVADRLVQTLLRELD